MQHQPGVWSGGTVLAHQPLGPCHQVAALQVAQAAPSALAASVGALLDQQKVVALERPVARVQDHLVPTPGVTVHQDYPAVGPRVHGHGAARQERAVVRGDRYLLPRRCRLEPEVGEAALGHARLLHAGTLPGLKQLRKARLDRRAASEHGAHLALDGSLFFGRRRDLDGFLPLARADHAVGAEHRLEDTHLARDRDFAGRVLVLGGAGACTQGKAGQRGGNEPRGCRGGDPQRAQDHAERGPAAGKAEDTGGELEDHHGPQAKKLRGARPRGMRPRGLLGRSTAHRTHASPQKPG